MADVIVVGAGISGLSAAKWLFENGANVLVLESRERVGGRTYTIKNKEVGYADLGASYVGPTQDHLLRLADDLGVLNYKVNEVENLIYYENGRRTYYQPNTLPTFWNPLINMDINNYFRLLDKMGEEIPAEAPWNAPHAEEWDRTTVKEFIAKHVWTRTGRIFATLFLTVMVTNEPYESSLLWHLWYVKVCGGTKRTLSTTNGAQERKFLGGSQQICLKIAERIGENRVLLKKPVVGIVKTQEGFVVQALDGSKYKAKYVIIAIPPILQTKIHYDPPLPPERNQLLQRMPMGSAFKVILYYREAFWKKKNCCGTMIIVGDDVHPVGYTLDDTKPDGSYPALVGFIFGEKARRLVAKTKDERKILLSKSYAKVLNDSKAEHPVHYEEICWMNEQYSGGCCSTCPPGFLTIFGRKLREPIGGIFFAGTETATSWAVSMEGGVQAGERAAREVLCEMGRLSVSEIWRKEPTNQVVFAAPFEVSIYQKYMPSVPGFFKMIFFASIMTTLVYKKRCVRYCVEMIYKRFA